MNDAIDRESLMERVDDDLELLAELVEIYEEDAALHLGSIKTAISALDGEQLTKSAHSLKGSSFNMSADGLAAMAQNLEIAGKEGKFDDCPQTLTEMEAEFVRVMEGLKAIIS